MTRRWWTVMGVLLTALVLAGGAALLAVGGSRPTQAAPPPRTAGIAAPLRTVADVQLAPEERRVFDGLDGDAQAALLESSLFSEGRVTGGEALFLQVVAPALGAAGRADAGDAMWAAAQQFRDGWFSWMAPGPAVDEPTRAALRTILTHDPEVYQRAHTTGVFRQFPLATAKVRTLTRLAVAVSRHQTALVDTLIEELHGLP